MPITPKFNEHIYGADAKDFFTAMESGLFFSVGPPFYNTVIIPIVILFLFFMSVGPQVGWIRILVPLMFRLNPIKFSNLGGTSNPQAAKMLTFHLETQQKSIIIFPIAHLMQSSNGLQLI